MHGPANSHPHRSPHRQTQHNITQRPAHSHTGVRRTFMNDSLNPHFLGGAGHMHRDAVTHLAPGGRRGPQQAWAGRTGSAHRRLPRGGSTEPHTHSHTAARGTTAHLLELQLVQQEVAHKLHRLVQREAAGAQGAREGAVGRVEGEGARGGAAHQSAGEGPGARAGMRQRREHAPQRGVGQAGLDLGEAGRGVAHDGPLACEMG